MDLTMNDEVRDTKAKKKYQLSLRKAKQNIRSSPECLNKDTEPVSFAIMRNFNKTTDTEDSQNFMLRLSDSVVVDDTYDGSTQNDQQTKKNCNQKEEIILISDSSEDDTPEKHLRNKYQASPLQHENLKKKACKPSNVYTIESSDSDDIDYKPRKVMSNTGNFDNNVPKHQQHQKSNALQNLGDIISDTGSGSNNDKENIFSKLKITPVAQRIIRETDELLSQSEKMRRILMDNRSNINTPGSAQSLKEISTRTVGPKKTPISAKIFSRATVLSKKETRAILKVVRSRRVVYDSPGKWKKPVNSDESNDEDENVENSTPESEIGTRRIVQTGKAAVIDETESEDDEVIQGSQVDLSKPYKTHVSRFLDPAITDAAYAGLSERKKQEISQWLMANSQSGRSDSSVSNISASNKNSPSSGNSSLERLEMNYETPNNRDKFHKTGITGEKSMDAPNSTRSLKTVRQTTIDNFIKTTKDGTHKVLTPIINDANKKKDLIPASVKEATNAMGIMDCADILDNLYGNVWRAKANDLLPASEPRKQNIMRQDKGVQTERKAFPKTRKNVRNEFKDTSNEEEFDTFVKNIKPNLNSTKKPTVKMTRRKCSFIHDSSSSSDSNCESTYLTALTHPQISDANKMINRPTPSSVSKQKIMTISDSDTEDEIDKGCRDNRRRLSFSEDDSDSSTSEFDPYDVIPPKYTTNKLETMKTTGHISKTKKATNPVVRNTKFPRAKTFLESLSAAVPITEAHPEAKKYRQSYKTTKEELCKYLYKLYNEKIFDKKLPHDMAIEWNVRMRGTAGFCYNKRSVKALGGITRSSRIVLATKILDTPDRLRDTLVHEMCHAAAWLINDVSDGHGPFWKAWASKAMRAFPELPPIKRCHDYKITTKFTYRCTKCGYSIGRHSKSLNVETKRCGHCYGKFELLINRVTKSGTMQVETPKAKQPSAFALFVKENYRSVKKELKGVAHKEVMQILGQQFSAIKISKKTINSNDNNPDNASSN